jgi:3-phosphoshikimate 1-carboxyvinyltransferase
MEALRIRCNKKEISGTVKLPASKSMLNRMIILAELAGTDLKLDFSSEAEDVRRMVEIVSKIQNSELGIRRIDCGNAGTVLRFITSVLAVREGQWLLTGTDRMKERPIGPLVEVLQRIGCNIAYTENEGFPPILITGKPELRGGDAGRIPGNISSQFLSSLLMLGAFLPDGIKLTVEGKMVSRPYLDMTISLLNKTGIKTNITYKSINDSEIIYHIQGGQHFSCDVLTGIACEKDWSSASYFYEMASFSEHCELSLPGLTYESLQGDSVCVEIFRRLGIQTHFTEVGAILRKQSDYVKPSLFTFDFTDYPDLAMTVAVTCAGLGIEAQLSGLEGLRIKESDRLTALVTELNRCGCPARIESNSLHIPPDNIYLLKPVTIQSYSDHRMAMAFAPLAMVCGEICIEDPEVVRKSFPGFWEQCRAVMELGVDML